MVSGFSRHTRRCLPRLRSPNEFAALRTAPGAHHWDMRYLEFGANQGSFGDIIQLGDGSSAQNTLEPGAASPRAAITSTSTAIHCFGQKRGIALNAAHVTIADSYIAECKGVGQDTQAIGGWNGPGPYVIENNYLEGAGENVMFGGADPAIPEPGGRRHHVPPQLPVAPDGVAAIRSSPRRRA